MCSVFRSDCVDMLGRGPHGLGSRASLGSRTKKFCIPDRVIRKPNPPAAGHAAGTDVAQSMCGSREQRVLTTIAVVVSACVNPYPTRVDPYTVASVDT
jgi:hypothetical protein